MIVNDMDQAKITEIRIETRWNQFWLHVVDCNLIFLFETEYEFNILIFVQYTGESQRQLFAWCRKFLALANSFLSVESRDNFFS